ncbi:4-Cys prefix domain-containing protein [Nodularia spumigena]
MIYCLNPNCLKPNPDNFKYCHKCGTKLLLTESTALSGKRNAPPCLVKLRAILLTPHSIFKRCVTDYRPNTPYWRGNPKISDSVTHRLVW